MSVSDGDAVLTPVKEGEEEEVWLGRVSDCRTIQEGIRQVDGKFLSQSCMSKEPRIWQELTWLSVSTTFRADREQPAGSILSA